MKKKKYLLKLATLLIACILTVTSVPMPIVSLDVDEDQNIIENDTSTDTTNISIDNSSLNNEYNSTDVFIVEEDVSKRGEFEKHYLCSDGSYISVSYAEAVHYLDNDNTWQDVDQSLALDAKTGVYKNGESDFAVSFSEKASNKDMVSISKGEHKMSWGIEAAKDKSLSTQTMTAELSASANVEIISDKVIVSDSSAKIKSKPKLSYSKASERLITSEDSFVLPNASSQITYDDVFVGEQNVSIQYTVFQNKIEEDIIIYNKCDIDSVSMNVDVGTLIPVVNDDKSVDFVDDENIMQFHIDIPYMIDADMNVCNDIEVLASKEGTNCTITYIPNKEWFDSEERVFPIVLDPAITTSDYSSSIEDTYVEENSPTIHTSEQYLIISNNGENRRKAFIRIKKLPMIDESMPIISSQLTLKTTNTPFIDTQLRLSCFLSFTEIDEITFEYLDGIDNSDDYGYDYEVYNMLPVGATQVTFDISSYIHQMYDDEKYYNSINDWYGADFIVEYAEEETISIYPFYSSEYTDKSCRPTLTVRYGYSLPAGMLDGEVYSFQSAASGAFMSVLSDNPNITTNVFQKNLNYDSNTYKYDISTLQQFKLEYVSSTGGYLLRPIASMGGNGLVVEVNNPSLTLLNGANVQLYSRDTSRMQEWLIVPYNDGMYRIVPRTQMTLALKTSGYDDGSNSDRGSLNGNIYVQRLDVNSDFQLWYIYDSNGDLVDTPYRSGIESGCYFVTNSFNGKYLHNTGTTLNCVRDRISNLGYSTVNWEIVNLGDGYCTIQRSNVPGWYLSPTSVSGGISVRFVHSSTETIPDVYKWALEVDGSCITIRHKVLGYYLYDNGSANVWLRPKYTQGTQDYERQKWRFADEDNYHELRGFSISDMVLERGESKLPTITQYPNSATWGYIKDFEYTITSGSQYISFNATNYRFTGFAPGTAQVKVVHKTTGVSYTFDIVVNPTKAIIIIPGIMGTELVLGEDVDDYQANDELWGKSLIDECIPNEDKLKQLKLLKCDENGESIYKVNVVNNSYGMFDIYQDLYETLYYNYGNTHDVKFFAYDWRLSNSISADKLNEFIEDSDYDEVYLVAHSMGGLVASGYLALGEYQRGKVKQLITLGSPLLGTPVMPYVWGSSNIDAIGLGEKIEITKFERLILRLCNGTIDIFAIIFGNYTSVYELFPSEKYFDSSFADKTYLNMRIDTPDLSGEINITTYNGTRAMLELFLNFYNTDLADLAEEFHDSLYINDYHMTELVNTYYLVGNGIKTIDQVVLRGSIWNDYSEEDNTIGDSVVPIWSATLGNRQLCRAILKNVDHMGLISDQDCLYDISRLISGDLLIPEVF